MTCYDVPTEDPHARLEPEYDEEAACIQCVALHRELASLRQQLAAYKCKFCEKLLTVRSFQGFIRLNGPFCTTYCWTQHEKQNVDI